VDNKVFDIFNPFFIRDVKPPAAPWSVHYESAAMINNVFVTFNASLFGYTDKESCDHYLSLAASVV
jgi:hypothetical protein